MVKRALDSCDQRPQRLGRHPAWLRWLAGFKVEVELLDLLSLLTRGGRVAADWEVKCLHRQENCLSIRERSTTCWQLLDRKAISALDYVDTKLSPSITS